MKPLQTEVIYQNELVGLCEASSTTGDVVFEYAPDFLKKGIELSPFLMPTSSNVFEFSSKRYNPETFKHLSPMIADSLPDDFGNQMFNRWLVEKNIRKKEISPLERLTYMGNRGMGALEYKPAHKDANFSNTDISIEDLLNVVEKILQTKESNMMNLNEVNHLNLLRIGSSAGGARAKALIAINEKENSIKAGDILQGKDYDYFLIKFDGLESNGSKGYGIMEYIYYQMALECGIAMSFSDLLEDKEKRHFITKRFDREEEKKIHTQTLCGLTGIDFRKPHIVDYTDIFNVLNALKLSHKEHEELFRRMVFNVAAMNNDDHTKNFSFQMKNNKWTMAPAYDLTFSYNPSSIWIKNHQITINGKAENIDMQDFMKIADDYSIKNAESIVGGIIDTINEEFPKLCNEHHLKYFGNIPIQEIQNLIWDNSKNIQNNPSLGKKS